MNFLITGGEGFIGRYLRNELEKEGHSVKTLDIDGTPDFHVSILNYLEVVKSLRGIDGLFHLAATTSPPQFEDDLVAGFNTNVNGTLNVLKAAAENGVKRAVIASSSAIYGDLRIPGKEDFSIDGHRNMYSTTKLVDEYIAKYFTLRRELEVVCLRYFNAYGIGENTKGMYSSPVSKFLESVSREERPVIFGDGNQSRDFVYVKDIASATSRAMQVGTAGEIYNVGTGVSVTFNDIMGLIQEVLGRKITPEYVKNPFKNYQIFTQADVAKIEKALSWKAKYSLREGIREMAIHMDLVR